MKNVIIDWPSAIVHACEPGISKTLCGKYWRIPRAPKIVDILMAANEPIGPPNFEVFENDWTPTSKLANCRECFQALKQKHGFQ